MRVDLDLTVTIDRSPRCVQLEGLFDVPPSQRAAIGYHFDVPLEARDWQIGLITGPSGAGKSSVARALFGDAVVERYEWPDRRAVVDGFGDLGIRDISQALSSVGFRASQCACVNGISTRNGGPPAWLRKPSSGR